MEEANKKLEEAKKLEESYKSKKLEDAKKPNEDEAKKSKKDDEEDKDGKKAKDKSDKETILSEISKLIDAKFAQLQDLQSKVQELSAKVRTPDRKTLSVAFDTNVPNSNLGMLGFLQDRIK